MDGPVKEQPETIIPETIGGMLTSKRYARLRKMGIKADEIAALVLLHERGQYPGQNLFLAQKKKEILTKKHKKLRLKAQKEILAKFREMRGEWKESLLKAKKELEGEGVDFDKARTESEQRQKEIKELVKEEVKKIGRK